MTATISKQAKSTTKEETTAAKAEQEQIQEDAAWDQGYAAWLAEMGLPRKAVDRATYVKIFGIYE